MKVQILVFIFFTSLNFCIAVNIQNFSCPEQVQFEQDFLCTLDIEEVSGLYDLKIYITGEGSGINKIWGDSGWTRSDWYLKSAIYRDGVYEIRLKIDKDFSGEANGILRLRENGCTSAFYEESFLIYIGEKEVEQEEIEEELEESEEELEDELDDNDESENLEESIDEGNESLDNLSDNESTEENLSIKEKETIYLGSVVKEEEEKEEISKRVINLSDDISINRDKELVYESKSEKIKRYGFYFFIGLILLTSIYFLFNKLKNGHRNYDY